MKTDSERMPEKASRRLGDIVDSFPLTRTHYVALTLVVLGGLFEVFEQVLAPALGPSLQVAFGINAAGVSLLSSVTLLSVVVGGIVGGFLGDRVGRRLVLMVSLVIYSCAALASGLAPNYEMLVVFRIIAGLGVGGEIAVGLTILSELSPTRVRGVFVSLFNTVSAGLGNFITFAYVILIIGPFAILVGAGEDAWRWVFGLLIIPVVLVAFFRRYLPESPSYLLGKRDIKGVNESLTRLATGKLTIRKGDEVIEYANAETIALSESGQVSASAPIFRQLMSKPLRSRVFILGFAAFLAWGFEFTFNITMPLLLVDRGFSIADSLTLTMVQHVGALVGAIAASILSYYVPRRYVVLFSALGGGITVYAFLTFANTALMIVALGFTIRIFTMLVNTTIWLWAPELFPTHVRALGTALVINIGFLGGALVPLVTGHLYDLAGAGLSFGVMIVIYIGVALLASMAMETKGKSLEQLHAADR